jgi:hypothetical protein
MINMKGIYSALFFMILSFPVLGQDKWGAPTEGELEDSQVIIEKNRKIELPRVQRNFQKVPKLKPSKDSIAINYQWKELTPQLNTINPSLRVLRIKDDRLEKLFANQVSLGFGNYASSFLSAQLANKRDKNKSYGLQLYHKHYNRGSVDAQYSASGNQYVNPYLRLINKDYMFAASLIYDRFDNYAYGDFENVLSANDLYERGDFQKLYQNVEANIQFENRNIENKLDFKLKLNAKHFFSAMGAKESVVSYELNNSYSLNKAISFGIPISGFFGEYTSDGESDQTNRYLLKVKPQAEYLLNERLVLNAGINIVGENDKLRNMGKLHFYPILEATFNPVTNLILKAGISGDVERQLFQDFAYQNPYIDQIDILNSTLIPFKFNVGLNANLLNRVNITAEYAIGTVKNQYFYQNSINGSDFPTAYSTTVYYVEQSLTKSSAQVALTFNVNKTVSLNASANYLEFSHDSISLFPNTPKLGYTFTTNFNIKDKLIIGLSGFGRTDARAYLLENNTLLLDDNASFIVGYIDLGLSLKYNLTSRSTVFIDSKNLIAKAYKDYLNYPGRGFQIMAGFTYSF